MTSKGSSTGSSSLSGLPFATSSTCAASFRFNNASSSINAVSCVVVSGTTTIQLEKYASGTCTVLSDTDFNNNSTLTITGVYFVA